MAIGVGKPPLEVVRSAIQPSPRVAATARPNLKVPPILGVTVTVSVGLVVTGVVAVLLGDVDSDEGLQLIINNERDMISIKYTNKNFFITHSFMANLVVK